MKNVIISLACLSAMISCAQKETTMATKKPNIIFIMADDLGYETMAINGGESYSTPYIDAMAKEGMRFEHTYAQPQCTPSRVQLLTGIYNVRNYVRFGELDTSQTTMAQVFRNAGYTTGVAGKWQLGKDPDNPDFLGFDDYLLWQVTEPRIDSIGYDPVRFPGQGYQSGGRDNRYSQPVLDHNGKVITYEREDYGPKLINEFSLDFIERNSKEDKPFFLFYSMILTHCPFSPTPDSPDFMENDTTVMTYKGDDKYFDDMVNYMDKMVGNIDKKLQELGIAENTILVFTGDNGTDAPVVSRFKGRDVEGGKFKSTDAGTRVPMVVKWPGVVEPGTVNTDLVDFTDFMPTFLDVAHVQVPDSLRLDGKSFYPQLKGEKGTPRDWIYSWFLFPLNDGPKVFARNQKYKLYDDGQFFNVSEDYLEENPIPKDSLDEDTLKIYNQLSNVIDGYAQKRLDAIPSSSGQ